MNAKPFKAWLCIYTDGSKRVLVAKLPPNKAELWPGTVIVPCRVTPILPVKGRRK